MIKGTQSYLAGLRGKSACPCFVLEYSQKSGQEFNSSCSWRGEASPAASQRPGWPGIAGCVFHRAAPEKKDRARNSVNSLAFKMTTNHPNTRIAVNTYCSVSQRFSNMVSSQLSHFFFHFCF